MEKQTLVYYDWNDIEEFLCDELVIRPCDFRDYNNVVGGPYKDLWHVWLDIDGEVRNGAYNRVNLDDVDYIIDKLEESYGHWVDVLREPLTKLADMYGDEDKCLMIYYYW